MITLLATFPFTTLPLVVKDVHLILVLRIAVLFFFVVVVVVVFSQKIVLKIFIKWRSNLYYMLSSCSYVRKALMV